MRSGVAQPSARHLPRAYRIARPARQRGVRKGIGILSRRLVHAEIGNHPASPVLGARGVLGARRKHGIAVIARGRAGAEVMKEHITSFGRRPRFR